jgi:hypothetical protein
MRHRLLALLVAVTSFVTPAALMVARTPHPPHPGHVHGIT